MFLTLSVYCVCCLLATAASLALPIETTGRFLPETSHLTTAPETSLAQATALTDYGSHDQKELQEVKKELQTSNEEVKK